jgi:hypothetical protein
VYGIHNNHDHIDEGERVKEDRGWEKGEGGRMERDGRKIRETGDKAKRKKGGEGREKEEEEWEKTTPCPPPHRFRDSFCLFGITNAHHTPVI